MGAVCVATISLAVLAGLVVVELPCRFHIHSAPPVVVAVTIPGSWESADREAYLVCWAGPSEGVTSENITHRSSIERSADLCIAESLKMTSALRMTWHVSGS